MHSRILLSHKKNGIMTFAATWMALEIIILSQTKTNTLCHLYVESKKIIQMNLFTKEKQTPALLFIFCLYLFLAAPCGMWYLPQPGIEPTPPVA